MADQAKYTVSLEFQTTGADKEVQNLRTLQDGIDELSRKELIGDRSTKRLSDTTEGLKRSLTGASAGADQAEQSIVSLRYANYDLASSLLRTSAAITAVGASTLIAFGSQERAFADVERTLEGGTIQSVEALRQSFQDLSTEIPKSFNELSEIATLGNQLGVVEQDLQAFTETVAAFSAITGISADSASQAFGKLGNLLGVQVTEFDRLGSSIALVGRTTAATESQIISIASEIAPAAAAAGLSADAVIGLSGALGSLRVPPERSRSTILQFFETLNTAVANGGEDLQDFATVVGVTSNELESLVRSGQGEDILRRFVSSASTKDTVELTQALQNLGLAGLRTNPTIRALAGSMDLFNSSIATGKQGFAENTELQRQMAIIVDTLASRFQILLNAVTNFAAQVGSELAPAFGALIDFATDGLVALTEFARSPVGEALTRTISVIAGSLAIWAALRGAIALATASTYALSFVVRGLGGAGIINGLKGLAGAMIGVGAAGKAGATGALALRGALLALGRAVVIGAVFSYVAEWIFNTGEAAQETGRVLIELTNLVSNVFNSIAQSLASTAPALATVIALLGGSVGNDSLSKGIRGVGQGLISWGKGISKARSESYGLGTEVSNLTDFLDGLGTSFEDADGSAGDFNDTLGDATQEVRTLLDYAGDLAKVWDRAFDIRFSGQSTLDKITSSFIDLQEAADASAKRIRDLKNDIQGLESDINIQEYFLGIAIEYGDTKRAAAIEAELARQRAELADKTADVQREQDLASKSLEGNSAGAIQNRRTIQDLVREYQAHIGALAASGLSQDQLAAATARLRADFIRQATQLGYNSKELEVYASAFDDVAYAISNVPRNITVAANANPAIQAMNELRASSNDASNAISNLRSNIGRGVGSLPAVDTYGARLQAMLARLNSAVALLNYYRSIGSYGNFRDQDNYVENLRRQIANGNFATGGFTGRGGMYEPAGTVHRGEYVIPKRDVNQSTGLPYADALGRLMTGIPGQASAPASSGGGSSGPTTVALTAGTIQAIAQATGKNIYLNGRLIADSSANSYQEDTVTGRY